MELGGNMLEKILKDDNYKKMLTEKQKQALELAIKHEYYSWPKGITLEQLAEKIGVSRSVFQEHLRKAEEKIMPGMIDKLAKNNSEVI